MSDLSSHFHYAPRDVLKNLEWRLKIRRAALQSKEVRDTMRQACFEDPLLFFQFAMWLIEPRGQHKVLPFCVWDMQIPAIEALVESVKNATPDNPIDVLFDKSRTRGATWICLGVILWFWSKDPLFSAGLISRNIESVDKKNDLGTLFPKLDWAISMLPYWMRPLGFNVRRDRSQTDHVWHNCELGGTIAGTACTAEAFSSGRLSVLLYDEAAKVDHDNFQAAMDSTLSVTDVRWIVSTHYGDSGPFYDMVYDENWVPSGKIFPLGGSGVYRNTSGSIKVVLDWKDHEPHGKLAYRFVNGQAWAMDPLEAIDVQKYIKENQANLARLRRRGFIKEGRIRSPWYDRKCLQKGATPQGIAQDLDRDPRSTVGKLFNPEIMDSMGPNLRPPKWQGDVLLRNGDLHFVQQEDGPLKLWFDFTLAGDIPKGKYCLASDPGSGIEGATTGNSTICGGNAATGEQVLEWCKQVSESRLADLAVALGEWMNNALLIWEAAGPYGKRFAIRAMDELGYWNVWKRPAAKRPMGRDDPDRYGWPNVKPRDKIDLFNDLCFAMDDGEFIPRSAEMIAECRGWELDDKGLIVYHGTGHGDRAIAAGLCRKGMKDLGGKDLDKKGGLRESVGDEWTMAGRLARRRAAETAGVNDVFAGFRGTRMGLYR